MYSGSIAFKGDFVKLRFVSSSLLWPIKLAVDVLLAGFSMFSAKGRGDIFVSVFLQLIFSFSVSLASLFLFSFVSYASNQLFIL